MQERGAGNLAAAAASVVAAVAVLCLVRPAHFAGCEASKLGHELGAEQVCFKGPLVVRLVGVVRVDTCLRVIQHNVCGCGAWNLVCWHVQPPADVLVLACTQVPFSSGSAGGGYGARAGCGLLG